MSVLLPLYRTATVLGAPAISWYLHRRLARGKEDGERFHERKGEARRPRPTGPLIWVHGASVGESLTMLPLIERLLQAGPELNVLVTTGTVTSANLLRDRLPPGAFHQYVPVDRRTYVTRFLDHWRPDLVLWAESEFWPNLVTEPAARGIPMILVNGRISPESFAGWRRYPGLIGTLLAGFTLCLAQAEQDAERLRALGAPAVKNAGNLKYAVPPLPADAAELGTLKSAIGERPCWLAASTHPGEERLLSEVHRDLKAAHPGLLSVIVPRHPERGPAIAQELSALGLNVARRATAEPVSEATDIYLADTLGELGLFCRLCPVVFMGKSLVDLGGQNPLEPARLGRAVLFGPHMWNFPEITEKLVAAGGGRTVTDAAELAAALGGLLADEAAGRRQGDRALEVAESEAHVLETVIDELRPFTDVLGQRTTAP